jgi:hypothetical protein
MKKPVFNPKIRDTVANIPLRVYTVHLQGEHVATIQAKYTKSTVQVVCLQYGSHQQNSFTDVVRGSGYDKLATAMHGNTVVGIELSNSWQRDLEKAGCIVSQLL